MGSNDEKYDKRKYADGNASYFDYFVDAKGHVNVYNFVNMYDNGMVDYYQEKISSSISTNVEEYERIQKLKWKNFRKIGAGPANWQAFKIVRRKGEKIYKKVKNGLEPAMECFKTLKTYVGKLNELRGLYNRYVADEDSKNARKIKKDIEWYEKEIEKLVVKIAQYEQYTLDFEKYMGDNSGTFSKY